MQDGESHMPANRALSGKVVLGEPPVDDADASCFSYVTPVKVPAFQQANSHGWEKARRNKVDLRVRVLTLFGSVPFHEHAVTPGALSQHGRTGVTGGLYSGQCAKILE